MPVIEWNVQVDLYTCLNCAIEFIDDLMGLEFTRLSAGTLSTGGTYTSKVIIEIFKSGVTGSTMRGLRHKLPERTH